MSSFQYFVIPTCVTMLVLAPGYYYYYSYNINNNQPWRENPPPVTQWFPPLSPPAPPPPPQIIQSGSKPVWTAVKPGTFPDHHKLGILPNFPPAIQVNYTKYENWAKEIGTNAWIAYPENAYAIIELANWARLNSYRIRPSGYRSSWSPLTTSEHEAYNHKVLLVDTTEHLTNMQIQENNNNNNNSSITTFWAEPGISLETVLTQLEEKSLGLPAFPAFGRVSLGGALATGGHGLGLKILAGKDESNVTDGENKRATSSFGSLSNRVMSLTAVVYDPKINSYALKEFHRSDPEIKAFLVNFGTTFITNVTLQAEPLEFFHYKAVDVNPEELLFSEFNNNIINNNISNTNNTENNKNNSFINNLETTGRAMLRFSPSDNKTTLRTWTVTPTKPDDVEELKTSLKINPAALGNVEYWGSSKNLLLYSDQQQINPETDQKVSLGGWAILVNQANAQRVIQEFYYCFQKSFTGFQEFYPNVNISFEAKVSGLDDPREVNISGAEAPVFSALAPVPQRPDFNVSVWLNLVTSPTFANPEALPAIDFFNSMEEFILDTFNSDWSIVRVEWPSAWSFTETYPWTKSDMTRNLKILGGFDRWQWAVQVLRKYDPWGVFMNDFVQDILV